MATRRYAPDRRDQIIDATLEVIATEGVAGTTARKIAARADVPLGSITYHFESMDDLLREAFTRYTTDVSGRSSARLAAATTRDEAKTAVVEVILRDLFDTPESFSITLELYNLASRRSEYRKLAQDWMARSRASFRRHFDEDESRMLDALVEGMSIHQSLDPQADARAIVRRSVERILS
ncbi:TetR family transcriptional regulator [Rhodococcus sp. F64268]|uniref:TetR/AcrR family transcriptional regulator n=1 Tax=Rhodococcus sp. F64268 TaxID=2926402 RepID=UPI001FF24C2B|nr:TetR family transcriptional regulator [Rhodococcus sp. F64268]MCK0089242.1 TetR family transcriptional regulator [Rhodococcus sp. F64268]